MARKILLADDSVTAQNMGRRILTDAGYDVTTVNNGSAALKRIAESKPDLIILDVYMPGYGGLEVCQRLREAPETARIPVLLTVGKLEPFKADESRRVRADGFIVKQFEASELLTALAKLEDKIVPQGQPHKPSRFAKAMAAADESAREFGDSETGWKNRLSIPPPHSKPREVQEEESPATVAGSDQPKQSTDPSPSEMKSGLEEALLSSLPQDITPEEIAAIKAAAAAFSLPIDEVSKPQPVSDRSDAASEPEGERHGSESVASQETETSAMTFASAPERQAETAPEDIAAQVETEPAATAEKKPASEVMTPGEAVPESLPPAPVFAVSPASEASQSAAGLGDEEVTAALAYLAPSNGHGEGVASGSALPDFATREQVPITMAAGAAAEEFSGPRWIAEPVGLTEDETSLVLEQEMQRAFAAFAAADAARLSFTSSRVEVEPVHSSLTTETVAFVPENSSAGSFSNSGNSDPAAQEFVAQTAAPSAEEPAVSDPHAEVSSPAVDAVGESVVPADTVPEISAPEYKENTAFAAAAAAGPSVGDSAIAAEAVSQPVPQIAPESAASGREGHGESDLAAAWANWKHIRETVLGSHVDSQAAQDTTAAVEEARIEAPAAEAESQAAESAPAGEESEEISNIVDSVLADLKPKLMQEIARKMGKDQKKK